MGTVLGRPGGPTVGTTSNTARTADQPATTSSEGTTPQTPNTGWGAPTGTASGAAWIPRTADPAAGAFQFQLAGFTPGAKLEVKDGDYKGHGFGGQATVNAFDSKHMDLDVAASAMMGLVKVKVKLKWDMDDAGNVKFFGGRTDKAPEPGQPANVQKALSIKSQSGDRTVFELPVERNGQTVLQDVLVEKTRVKGKDALHVKYDAYEMTLVPK